MMESSTLDSAPSITTMFESHVTERSPKQMPLSSGYSPFYTL